MVQQIDGIVMNREDIYRILCGLGEVQDIEGPSTHRGRLLRNSFGDEAEEVRTIYHLGILRASQDYGFEYLRWERRLPRGDIQRENLIIAPCNDILLNAGNIRELLRGIEEKPWFRYTAQISVDNEHQDSCWLFGEPGTTIFGNYFKRGELPDLDPLIELLNKYARECRYSHTACTCDSQNSFSCSRV